MRNILPIILATTLIASSCGINAPRDPNLPPPPPSATAIQKTSSEADRIATSPSKEIATEVVLTGSLSESASGVSDSSAATSTKMLSGDAFQTK